jgi:hypothetical protein
MESKQIIKEFKPDVVIERWFCQRTIIENGQHDGNSYGDSRTEFYWNYE